MLRRPALAVFLFVIVGCDEAKGPAVTAAVETPERQFVFEGVQIEERRGERVLWSGRARKADGDLSTAKVEDVVLNYVTSEAQPRTFEVHSPHATLVLDDGKATFESVRIVDDNGGILQAGVAHYDEAADTLTADGPISFAAQGLEATARSGVVHLEEGSVDIEGPIRGRFVKPPAGPSPTAP